MKKGMIATDTLFKWLIAVALLALFLGGIYFNKERIYSAIQGFSDVLRFLR